MALTRTDRDHDLVVIVVTYNSRDEIHALLDSIRAESASLDLAVVVADNSSPDGTLAQLRATAPDVEAFGTGGNLGYAAAINAALRRIPAESPVMILNPDSIVEPGSLRRLLAHLGEPGVGAVVPRLITNDGRSSRSLRREPSIGRALGDALVGSRLRARPGAFAETVWQDAAYDRPHTIDWATGAAVLLSPDARRDVGAWDERFFLYSEETDYFRRLRMAGYAALYEPASTVRHAEGGSGSSAQLDALLAVNRIRYIRKHHSRAYAAIFRAAVVLSELLRVALPRHAVALRYVTRQSRWSDLPGPAPAGTESPR